MIRVGCYNPTVLSMVSLSLIGLIFASVIIFYTPATQDFPWRRPIIGLTYALVCILGSIAVFFPKKCSQLICSKDSAHSTISPDPSQRYKKRTTSIFGFKLTHGHHPDCEGFSDHEFQIGNKTFCAGCTGLLIGALVSLVMASAYFSNQVHLNKVEIPLIGFGFTAILVGLLTSICITLRSPTKLATNAFLIIGMTSILVGADALLHNIQIDLYIIALSILWLMTRISLSQLNHERICINCTERCVQAR